MTNPNDLAYPFTVPSFPPEGGLTKREYFAALAMQGLIVAHPTWTAAEVAVGAANAADNQIEALNNQKP